MRVHRITMLFCTHYDSKVITRFKVANAKHQTLKGGERQGVLDAVWEMYRESYKAIGMHLSSPTSLLDYDIWVLMYDGGTPVAFHLFKKTLFGLKTGLLGTDGSPTGKSAMKTPPRKPGGPRLTA